MLPNQHGRGCQDGDQDRRDVLRGLAAAVLLFLVLCGVVILAQA